ncbi:MAG: hypothetical protein KJ749_11495 [Planctomycetes bacterium]|nr:hypothetical protein [Planctomycetota bacterium]
MGKRRRVPGTGEHEIRDTIKSLVANNFPGCSVEFVGTPRGNRRRRTSAFRIVDAKGKYRTEPIWVGPSFYSCPNKAWPLREVELAKGMGGDG